MMKILLFSVLMLACEVWGHGRLLDPPNRSTLWRFPEDPAIKPYISIVEPNYSDNELYCGGLQHQIGLGGKCGLCGDPYDKVRENEAGGKYGKGIIVRQYAQGGLLPVTVELTAHHLGYFEFRLCKWDNPSVPGTLDCLNQNLLPMANGSTKYYPKKAGLLRNSWVFNYELQLPPHITCTQCILQWRYHAENTWACADGCGCEMGCGPQEEFYNCADIAIGSEPTLPPPGWNAPPTTSSSPSPTTTTTAATTTKGDVTQTTTKKTTTVSTEEPSGITCQNRPQGKYKADCQTFYTCDGAGGDPFIFECPPGTAYDDLRQMCDYPYNVLPPCGTKSAARAYRR